MNMSIPSTGAAGPSRMVFAFGSAWRAVHATARNLDAWFEARRRAANDRDVLDSMSDRDLLDIGLQRGSASAVSDRVWIRDYPL